MQRYEVFDHTAGAYCDPHKPNECGECKRQGWNGEYYLAADVEQMMDPRRWTKAQHDAWNGAIPDVLKAFRDLLEAS